jgi:hypothetical protein
MDLEGAGRRINFLIRDHDTSSPPGVDALLDAGIGTIRSAVQAPRMNSIMEGLLAGTAPISAAVTGIVTGPGHPGFCSGPAWPSSYRDSQSVFGANASNPS